MSALIGFFPGGDLGTRNSYSDHGTIQVMGIPATEHHFGVYCVYSHGCSGLVLCVRKSRGPYAGWLDLPGGAPLEHESYEQTLRREVLEETGATLDIVSRWHDADLYVEEDSNGRPISFHHTAKWCFAELQGVKWNLPECEDVVRLERIPKDDFHWRGELSPLLRTVLESIEVNRQRAF